MHLKMSAILSRGRVENYIGKGYFNGKVVFTPLFDDRNTSIGVRPGYLGPHLPHLQLSEKLCVGTGYGVMLVFFL